MSTAQPGGDGLVEGPLQRRPDRLSSLNLARDSLTSRCLGPRRGRMNGRLIWVSCSEDSSILPSRPPPASVGGHSCRGQVHALGVLERLDQPVDDPLVQSSRELELPAVDFTSNTPSPISSSETSKVPPPRSTPGRLVAPSLSSP